MIKNILLKAKKDVETAKDLFKSKHYDWCLFIWHLAIEKVLKAKIISMNKSVRYIHDLTKLSQEANILLDKNIILQLNEITSFNIEVRYDDYKLRFYRKATKEYTAKWAIICENFYNSIITTL